MNHDSEPCPCGSGQAFANCHGREALATSAVATAHTIRVEVPAGGVPGQVQNYIVVAGTDPKGAPGKYRVIFTLCRDGHLPTTRTAVPFEPVLPDGPDAASGGSKFVSLRVTEVTPHGRFEFVGVPNDVGHLARIESEPFNADGFHDAARKALDALAGFLSTWSCHLDLPIWIGRTHVTELATGGMQVDWTAPFADTELHVAPAASLQAEFKAYAGLYREALTSRSPAYEFLCLYKIAEAIWNLTWSAPTSLGMIHRPGATVPLPRGEIPTRCEMWVGSFGKLSALRTTSNAL